MAKKKLKKRAPVKKSVKKKGAAEKKARRVVKKALKKRGTPKKKRATPKKKKSTAKKRGGVRSLKKGAAKKSVKKKGAMKKKSAAAKRGSAKKVSTTKKRKVASSSTRKKPATTAGKSRAQTKPARNQKPAARMITPEKNGAEPYRGKKAYQVKKGEQYMSPQQLDHFNRLLLTRKKELMKEVDKTVNHMQTEATNFADPADRATQEEEFGLELRTRDRERKLLKKIDGALEMMGLDEYGYCSVCAAEIGIQRLEARPTATLCIDCKNLQELQERQLAD